MNVRRLGALWTLMWALIRHVVTLPLTGRKRPEPWLARLLEESLAPTPSEAWTYVAGTSRCIGCGVCDAVGTDTDSPSEWIQQMGRTPSDAPLVLPQAERLSALAREIERVCPARVPAADIARLVADQARMLGAAR